MKYRTSAHRRKKHHRSHGKTGTFFKILPAKNTVGIKLTVCACILALSLIFKLLLPGTYAALSDRLSGSVDFKSAFSAIGQGLGGEQKISEALAEAYRFAFISTDNQGADI